MHELTGYLVTTDRVHAEEALESLRSQGIPRPVVVVRNVRPLHAAHLPTLDCQTPYCLVLDDDTVLRPGVVQQLIDTFRRFRSEQPSAFKLNARVYAEARQSWDVGGLKMFYTPHLRRVGWPNAPHVSFAQTRIAEGMGMRALGCDIAAGVQKRGTNLDVYKKYLWIQLRSQAGQYSKVSLPTLVERARSGADWLWFAALGVFDGIASGAVSTSKDEDFLGPIGRTLDFGAINGDQVRRLLLARGLLPAQPLTPSSAIVNGSKLPGR